MKPKIAPSILAADFGNLESDIKIINNSDADWIHVDIMDGVFVPNISFGIPVCQAVQRVAKKPMDVHLMVVNPELHLQSYKDAGASILTVHYETCSHLHGTLQSIKALGCKAGVAINPHTNVDLLEDVLEYIDVALIMSVNPGYGGQQLIPATYRKIEKLKSRIVQRGLEAMIEIDGGVNHGNAQLLIDSGADILVAGSFVFNSADPITTIKELKGTYTSV